MRPPRPRTSPSAFTLLELAVVIIIIISLLTAGGVAMLMSVLSRKQHDDTQARIVEVIRDATEYYYAHGYFPCPSDLTKGRGQAGYGDGVGTGNVGSPDCTAARGIPATSMSVACDPPLTPWSGPRVGSGDVRQLAPLEEPAAADLLDAAVGGRARREAGCGVGRKCK